MVSGNARKPATILSQADTIQVPVATEHQTGEQFLVEEPGLLNWRPKSGVQSEVSERSHLNLAGLSEGCRLPQMLPGMKGALLLILAS